MSKYSEDKAVEQLAIGSEKVIRIWEWRQEPRLYGRD